MSTESIARELIVKAYDHHKAHARFEETQRSWFLAAYLTFTGLIISGILGNFFKNGVFISSFRDAVILLLLTNLIIGICVAFGIMKVTGEFRRHNDRAEGLLLYLHENEGDKHLRKLLEIAKLHTATYDLGKNRITAFFSVAAMHNYVLSTFIALDVALIVRVSYELQLTGYLIAIWAVTFLVSSALQQWYLKYVERQQVSVKSLISAVENE